MLHKIARDLFMSAHFARDLKESLCGPRRLFFSSVQQKTSKTFTVKPCRKLAESGGFLCNILKTGVENDYFTNSFALCFRKADLLHAELVAENTSA